MTVPRWVVVSLAASVVGYHVVVAIHALTVIRDPLPYLIAVGVFVAAATVSLLPWGGLRLPNWVAAVNLLLAMVIPEVVSTQISEGQQMQVDHAAWYVGGMGILMVITSVRRRHVFAWLGIAALVAHTLLLLGDSPPISPIGVGMSVAWVGISHVVSLTLERAEQDARQYADAARAAALWHAEAEAHVTERRARLHQTNRVARGVLGEIVLRRGRLTPALRAECVLLEATIRDEIRGRRLLDDRVRGAVIAARRSGVDVLVLDEGGLDELDAEMLDVVHGGLARAVALATARRIIVRTAQDRRDVAVTVVGVGEPPDAASAGVAVSAGVSRTLTEGELDDDVTVWFEIGFDGEVRGLH